MVEFKIHNTQPFECKAVDCKESTRGSKSWLLCPGHAAVQSLEDRGTPDPVEPEKPKPMSQDAIDTREIRRFHAEHGGLRPGISVKVVDGEIVYTRKVDHVSGSGIEWTDYEDSYRQ